MTPEQMQKIVDGAHPLATHVESVTGRSLVKSGNNYNCIELGYQSFFHQRYEVYAIADLRDQLAKREPMDLRDVDIPHGTIVLEK